MPQMAPMNWLTLFMFFSTVFIIFNMLNYFTFLHMIKNQKIKKHLPKFNWKW